MKTLRAKLYDYTADAYGPARTRDVTVVGETVSAVVKDGMFTITSTHKVREPIPNTSIGAPTAWPVGNGQYIVAPAAPATPAYRDVIQQKITAVRLSDLVEYTIE